MIAHLPYQGEPVPRIFTASWSTNLPVTVVRIGISRGTPRNQSGYRMLSSLAPGPWFRSVGPNEFERRYMDQLRQFDPEFVLAKICELSQGADAALLCFEAADQPAAWCHRGLVSRWFYDELGIEVCEWGYEACGCGHRHPKLYQPER